MQRRFERRDPTAVRRVAERTADVVPEAERAHARGERRALTTTGSARGLGRVPRVVGVAMQRALRGDAQPEVGQVRATDGDGTRAAHPLHERGIDRCHRVGERRDRLRGGCPCEVDVLLHRHGHAVQRPERTTRGDAIYGLDEQLLRELEPDLIVTQELCPVCAVSYDEVQAIAKKLPVCPAVIALDPRTFGETMVDVRTVAQATGALGPALDLIARQRARVDAVREAVMDEPLVTVAALEVAALAETITVTGETPVVDTQSARRQSVLTNEKMRSVSPFSLAARTMLTALL